MDSTHVYRLNALLESPGILIENGTLQNSTKHDRSELEEYFLGIFAMKVFH